MTTTRRIGIALVALTVAALAIGLWNARAWYRDSETLAQHRAAVSAASLEVTRLISLSSAASAVSLAQLRGGATSAFASELAAEASNLATQLRTHHVVAKGSVVSAGLGWWTGDKATVFIDAAGNVTNTSSSSPQVRSYRFKVDMQRVAGQWLVSGLEFVA